MTTAILLLVAKAVLRLNPNVKAPSIGVILVLCFVAMRFRIELRADYLALAVFAGALVVSTVKDNIIRPAAGMLVVALASNLHPGVALFSVALCGVVETVVQATYLRKFASNVAILAAWFCSPYGIAKVDFVLNHIFYRRFSILHNPDHIQFSLGLLRHRDYAASIGAALFLAAAGCIGYLRTIHKQDKRARHRTVFIAMMGLATALLFVTLNRLRTTPFLVVLLAPAASLALDLKMANAVIRFAAVTGSGFLAALSFYFASPVFGRTIDDGVFPVQCTKLLIAERPTVEIWADYRFGGYLVWKAPEYRVFADPRETPFWPIQTEFLGVTGNPDWRRRLLRKYNINVVLESVKEWLNGVAR